MRYIMKISYDGSNYSGYQIQNDKTTIQGELEYYLQQVLKEKVNIIASGRTDGGVSAICQTCHFDTTNNIDVRRSMGYLNSLLPKDIRILELSKTSDDFHARFSAKSKTYEYYFYIGMVNAYYEKFATYIGYDINIEAMINSCKYFLGEHDFSAFCASNTDVKNKVRIINNIEIKNIDDNLYKLEINGNGFLYNMVRIIMGTIVGVGLGKISMENIDNIILSKDRNKAGKTMPSKGLVLKNIFY